MDVMVIVEIKRGCVKTSAKTSSSTRVSFRKLRLFNAEDAVVYRSVAELLEARAGRAGGVEKGC